MKTNYQLPTAELTQAGTFFANLGLECPWVGEDAWCDLLTRDVFCQEIQGEEATCPPAVAAAVVWFAGEVAAWFLRTQPEDTYATARIGWGKYSKYDNDEHVYVDDGEGWMWQLRANEVPSRASTQLEAAAALILGVWQAMENDDEV